MRVSEAHPLAPMSRFLTHRKDFFQLDDATEYQLVTVQLHGRGVRERTRLYGRGIKTKRQQQVRAGELLVAEIDAKAGGFGVVPDYLDGAIVSSHYFLYKIDETVVDRAYLDYYLRSGQPEFDIQTFVQGSLNYAAIRPHHFPELMIPLPPLEEQRRIVARLDALRVRVEQALALQGAAIAEAEALIDASLYSIFCDAATADWQATMLEALTEIRAGVTLGRKLTGATIGVPYLRVANVQDGRLDLAEVKEVAIRPDELAKWRLQFGDLVLTEGGDFDKLGRGTIWRNEIVDCIHQNHIFRVRPNQEVILPEFLELEIRSPYGKGYFLSKAKKTTNLASINQAQLREFPVRFPAKARQATIVAEIGELHQRIETLIQAQRESEQELQAMLPAALDRAFRGNCENRLCET